MRLNELKTDKKAIIVKIVGHGAFRKRLIEMGFVKGREIEALLQAPMHDPVKYSLMGYEVSLRRAEANMIEIVPLEESGLTDESSHTNTLIEKKSPAG